jgi:hypothetical protein
MNKNHAFGFSSAHVFETAGTFTVTLTVTDSTGTSDTHVETIYVDDPDVVWPGTNTICYRNGGADDYTGCPSGASTINTASWSTVCDSVDTEQKRALLRRGDTWTSGGTCKPKQGPGMIGAFGSGDKPVIAPDARMVWMSNTHDFRFEDLKLDGSNATFTFGGLIDDDWVCRGTDQVDHVLFNRLDLHIAGQYNAIVFGNEARLPGCDVDDFPIHMFQIDNVHTRIEGDGNYAFFGGFYESAFMGNDYDGCSGRPKSHCWRSAPVGGAVISHNSWGRCIGGGLQVRAADWNSGYKPGVWSENIVISDNFFTNADCDGYIGLKNSSPEVDAARRRNVLIERNYMEWSTHSSEGIGICSSSGVTVRNNIADMSRASTTNWDAIRVPDGCKGAFVNENIYIYNNSCFDDDVLTPSCIEVSQGSGHIVRNNMYYCPNDTTCTVFDDNVGAGSTESNNLSSDSDFSSSPYTPDNPDDPNGFKLDNDAGAGAVARDAGFDVSDKVFLDYGARRRPTTNIDIGSWEMGAEYATPPGGPSTTPNNQVIGGSLGFNEPTTKESGAPLDNLNECTAVLTPNGGSSTLVTLPASSPNGGGVFDIDLSTYAGQTVEYYGSCTNADGEGPQSPKGSVEVALPLDPPAAPSIEVR